MRPNEGGTRLSVASELSMGADLRGLIGETVGFVNSLPSLVPQHSLNITGRTVMPITGFGGSDLNMLIPNWWLRKSGYGVLYPRIFWNVVCPNWTTNWAVHLILRHVEKTGELPCLLGHSLGGLIAKAISERVPDCIAGVLLLAAPLRDPRINPTLDLATRWVGFMNQLLGARPGCFRGTCECEFVQDVRRPLRDDVFFISVYTEEDQVADWKGCVLEEGPNRRNIPVGGTHSGLPMNPEALLETASVLPQVFNWKPAPTA